jgi:hypothetical protein
VTNVPVGMDLDSSSPSYGTTQKLRLFLRLFVVSLATVRGRDDTVRLSLDGESLASLARSALAQPNPFPIIEVRVKRFCRHRQPHRFAGRRKSTTATRFHRLC